MAAIKDIKIKGYCDTMNNELLDIKKRIFVLQKEVKKTYGEDSEIALLHERHLCEIAETIDWKLQILTKACPFDWKDTDTAKDIENTVSVGPAEKSIMDFSGGYVGG